MAERIRTPGYLTAFQCVGLTRFVLIRNDEDVTATVTEGLAGRA